MAHIHVPHEIPLRYLERSRTMLLVSAGMFAVGLLAFVVMLFTDPHTAWISYVSNWLFFASIAVGAVMLAVVTTIVSAKWNWSIRRLSVSFAACLPVAFVLMLPMLGLREDYFPWIAAMESDPIVQAKQAYLNIPFLLARNVVGALALFGILLYFAYLAIRPDLGLTRGAEGNDEGRARWRERLTTGWQGQEAEEVHSHRRMVTLAPAVVIVFAVVMSVFSFDWAMSLEPHWFSTLFGGWFFMGAFWGGLAATAVCAVWLRRQHPDFMLHIGIQQRHDLGKLIFGFTVFWAYLFWSQYIVIWYGKLPWEQAWMIHRLDAPWGAMSTLVLTLCFIVPFVGLISRQRKIRPAFLATFAGVILVGLWLERYMLVAPSLWHEGDPVFGVWHPLVALMFLGPFLFALRWFWSTFPMFQTWQPMAPSEMVEAERFPETSVQRAQR